MNTNREEVVVHWFRHGLRLHDNPSLIDGLSECDRFYPVFIFDGEVAGKWFEIRFIAELNFQGDFFFCFSKIIVIKVQYELSSI